MPRIKKGLEETPTPQHPGLAAELASELKSAREGGQPRIEEQHFPKTGAVRVTVLWDKWAPLPDEERSVVILRAYEQVEGEEFRDRIALAIGLTIPEAYESGMLPFRLLPVVRKGDPVTPEECARAMVGEGASILFDPNNPQLRLATGEEAEACRKRLVQALPGSEPVWVIEKEAIGIEK